MVGLRAAFPTRLKRIVTPDALIPDEGDDCCGPGPKHDRRLGHCPGHWHWLLRDGSADRDHLDVGRSLNGRAAADGNTEVPEQDDAR